MKNYLFGFVLLVFAAATIGASPLRTEVRDTQNVENLKGENKTKCVEVLEAKKGSPTCTTAKSISIKLKMNCEKPMDVMVCYKGKRGWLCKTFLNKKQGAEFNLSECDVSGPYVVYKRDAGSDVDFPSPK